MIQSELRECRRVQRKATKALQRPRVGENGRRKKLEEGEEQEEGEEEKFSRVERKKKQLVVSVVLRDFSSWVDPVQY